MFTILQDFFCHREAINKGAHISSEQDRMLQKIERSKLEPNIYLKINLFIQVTSGIIPKC